MYHGNLLSQTVREALIVLGALLSFRETSITRDKLSAATGLSAGRVKACVSKLLMAGWLASDSRGGLFLPPDFSKCTLSDLIELFDGWVHIGNANLDALSGVSGRGCRLVHECEDNARDAVTAGLSAIRIEELVKEVRT
ncbi:MAG: hypothetical protein LUD76_06755 [Alistipes sp.]|nr:hypothetical protein [Alistipes sp.]